MHLLYDVCALLEISMVQQCQWLSAYLSLFSLSLIV